jgi:ribosomal protein S18 acetylase RimI-like enzyme
MEIKRAIEFDDNIREQLGELYVNGFYDYGLKHITNNKLKLINAFSPLFILEYFYVAIIDNEIAGMAACMDKGHPSLNIDKKILIKNLGLFKGLLTYFIFKDSEKNYKIELDGKIAIIEHVTTNAKFKRIGVASSLIKYLFSLSEYKHYVLEVADTNINAVELYKKLGFIEIYRKKYMSKSGINYLLYMKYSKE